MEKGDLPEVVAKMVLAAATDPTPKLRSQRERWRARSVSYAVSCPHRFRQKPAEATRAAGLK